MTKYVGKILLWNSKRPLRKLQKILGGYFFLPHTVEVNQRDFVVGKTSDKSSTRLLSQVG